jgi:hypothetical protein
MQYRSDNRDANEAWDRASASGPKQDDVAYLIVGHSGGRKVYYPRGGVIPADHIDDARRFENRWEAEAKLSKLTGWGTLIPVILPYRGTNLDTLQLAINQYADDSKLP